MTDEQTRALDAAIEMLQRSYNPYSGFAVGACLVMEDGSHVTGTNVENAAYGPTICAERTAVVAANAQGKRIFRGIAITGRLSTTPDGDAHELVSPCGACRQVLFEMTDLGGPDHDPWVVLGSPSRQSVEVTSIRELLPRAFGPSDLHVDLTRYRG